MHMKIQSMNSLHHHHQQQQRQRRQQHHFDQRLVFVDDDLLIDDLNTVSYYDYGEHDAYNDEFIETSTQQLFSQPTTTTRIRIPSYHQRPPVIWNVNIDDSDPSTLQNSSSSMNSSLLFLLFIFILT